MQKWMLAAALLTTSLMLSGCTPRNVRFNFARWFGEIAISAAESAYGKQSNAGSSDEQGIPKEERHRRWEQETQQAFLRKSRRPWRSPKTDREHWQEEVDAALAR